MWCSSKAIGRAAGAALLAAALSLMAGCMADRPAETDIPWAAPQGWEGSMPLPSSIQHQYD